MNPCIFNEDEATAGFPTEISTISFWVDQVQNVMESKPICVIVRRYGSKKVDVNDIEADNDKLRSLVYLAVNHGAIGIIMSAYDKELHFMYKDKRLKSQLAKALQTLSPVILAGAVLDEVTITYDNGKIDYKAYMGVGYDHLYIVAVNVSGSKIRPTIHIPEFVRGSIYRMDEDGGGISTYDNWQFVDSFNPYQTHIYVLRTKIKWENVGL